MSDGAGIHQLLGILPLFPVTAGAIANQNGIGNVVFDLTGQLTTFNISSAVNSTVVVNQIVSLLDTINLTTNGGTISVGSGISVGQTVNATISGGGDYVVGGSVLGLLSGNGSLGFAGTGGTLTVGDANNYGTTTTTTPISGFTTASDAIDNQSLKFSGITGYKVTGTPGGTETVMVSDSSGDYIFELNNAMLKTGTYALGSGPLVFSQDKTGGTTTHTTVCFLRGTRIATPDGETAVESLNAGDMVATRENGETVFQAVTWVGHRSIDVGRTRGNTDAHPVRIRAGAFASNVPHRDLLVTPDHCVLVGGNLVPARMLVNGGSIIADTSISKYEFFHVELARHSILIAEGLETESYLDTGNRANFINVPVSSAVPAFGIDVANEVWVTRAAAPLAVDRETVEPIWQSLVERSIAIGFGAGAGVALEVDPELCVVTNTGVTVIPTTRDGRVYSFAVPSDARSIRIVSNTSRPSETVGPFVDDRRELGVLIGTIGLDLGFGRKTMAAADLAIAPRGWHAAEASCRWTDGDAVLPLNLSAATGDSVAFDLEVINAGPYSAKRAIARAA